MELKSSLVADQILWLRKDTKSTPMHVLKLVYLSHGWMLGLYGEELINEPVEAWTYGPVVPSIYYAYKEFRADPVTTDPINRTGSLGKNQKTIITAVVHGYRDYTAIQLSNITHRLNTPWYKTIRQYGIGAIIPTKLIGQYFSDRVLGLEEGGLFE